MRRHRQVQLLHEAETQEQGVVVVQVGERHGLVACVLARCPHGPAGAFPDRMRLDKDQPPAGDPRQLL